MIVKNEVHIVAEVLDAVAPYVSSWVIVDTGSDDGTQDVIRNHMDSLGIPGELHERPWRDFGLGEPNRGAFPRQGHADYIWVMDADDTIVGTPRLHPADRRHLPDALLRRQRRLLGRAVVPRRGARALAGRHPRVRQVGRLLRRVVRLEGDYNIEGSSASLPATFPGRSTRATAICCWRSSNATPRMPGQLSTWPRVTSVWPIWSMRRWYAAANPELGGWDEEVGYSLSSSRCRWSNSMSRGRTFRMPTCGPGCSDRPAPSRCMPSPAGVAPIGATGSATCSPSAPPTSHSPSRRHCLSADASMLANSVSWQCALRGSTSMPRPSRCAVTCWPVDRVPDDDRQGSRATATCPRRR